MGFAALRDVLDMRLKLHWQGDQKTVATTSQHFSMFDYLHFNIAAHYLHLSPYIAAHPRDPKEPTPFAPNLS